MVQTGLDGSLRQKDISHLGVLYALMDGEPVLDAPQIAKRVGFAPKRARDALDYLAQLGIVRAGPPAELGWRRDEGGGTNPATTYALSSAWGYAIGVAGGHRGVGTALIDASGRFAEPGADAECLVDSALTVGEDYEQALQTIAQQIVDCVQLRRAQLDARDDATAVDVRAITVALPGQVSGVRGAVLRDRRVKTILETFDDCDIAGDLAYELRKHRRKLPFDPLNVPVYLENDADVAALGELHFGVAQGCDSLLLVKVSAGIGAGVVIDGELHYGHRTTMGEIGHDPVHPAIVAALDADPLPDGLRPLVCDGATPACSCRVSGTWHLESLASASAVIERVGDPGAGPLSLAQWRARLEETLAAAASREPWAERAVKDAGALIGMKLNTLASVLGPQLVLVIGALAEADVLRAAIHDELEALTTPATLHPSDVRLGTRGDDARWIAPRGAARLALERGVWSRRSFERFEWLGRPTGAALMTEHYARVRQREEAKASAAAARRGRR
jgi:predicted NBD/HSP70 family sugar kinase